MKYLLKKETIIFVICILLNLQTYSQTDNIYLSPKNEFKIDALDLVLFTAIELSYEKLQESETGYGVSIYINLRSEDTFYEKFVVTPFFRFYFLNGNDFGAKGYFVELYSKFASGKNFEIENNNDFNENYFDISLGLGLGKKWVNKKGFTLETSFGIGRNLGLDKNSPDFAVRGGISLGYRF